VLTSISALGVLPQQALDPVPAHLRVLADNLFACADLEWPAIRAAKATRVQLGEKVDALVHSGSLSRCMEINAHVEAFRQNVTLRLRSKGA
jgi:hypothetical protein